MPQFDALRVCRAEMRYSRPLELKGQSWESREIKETKVQDLIMQKGLGE